MTADRPSTTAMRQLWLRMVSIYGHKWASVLGVAAENDEGKPNEAANTWSRGLAGITGEQLGAGLKACVSSSDPWPPTLPQFRAMCLGVPIFAAVYLVLTDKKRPRTAFARLTWSFVDPYRYRQAGGARAEKILQDAYAMAREHVMNGGSLPDPVSGELTHEVPVHKPAPPHVARAHLDAVNNMLRRKAQEAADETNDGDPEPTDA